MTKVEHILISKGHYLDDTYHLVMSIVGAINEVYDEPIDIDVVDEYNIDDDGTRDLCEDVAAAALAQCKSALTKSIEEVVEHMEDNHGDS